MKMNVKTAAVAVTSLILIGASAKLQAKTVSQADINKFFGKSIRESGLATGAQDSGKVSGIAPTTTKGARIIRGLDFDLNPGYVYIRNFINEAGETQGPSFDYTDGNFGKIIHKKGDVKDSYDAYGFPVFITETGLVALKNLSNPPFLVEDVVVFKKEMKSVAITPSGKEKIATITITYADGTESMYSLNAVKDVNRLLTEISP